MNGSRSSQLSCSRDTNMANIASRVRLKRSTNPSLRGWYGPHTMGSFSFLLCPVVQTVYVPWYCQIISPGLNVGIVEIRIWAAIYPLMRPPPSVRSYLQVDKPQCTL